MNIITSHHNFIFTYKQIFGLVLTAMLLFCPMAKAQTPPGQVLTLEQALTLAIQNNPQLKAAQSKLGVSQAEIITAGARLNPSLMSDNGIAEKTYRLGIEQTFQLGGKRHKRIALAQAQQDVLLAEINAVLLDLRANVRRAYTQLYYAQERLQTTRDIVATTGQLLDITQKREHAGDIARLDVLQADIVTVNARNDLQTANAQVVSARNSLNSLLDQPLDTTMPIAPPPSTLTPATPVTTSSNATLPLQGSIVQTEANLESLIHRALSRRPEITQIQQSIVVAQKQLELSQANRIPNLTVAAGPDRVAGSDGGNSVFLIGNLELPVFNRQQGPIQEALARRTQLGQEQIALKNRITLAVTNAYTAFISNRDRVLRYEAELLPKAEVVVKKSRQAFEEGKSPILIPINAQQAYINTRLGYLQALLDYQNAISDLERAIGTGL